MAVAVKYALTVCFYTAGMFLYGAEGPSIISNSEAIKRSASLASWLKIYGDSFLQAREVGDLELAGILKIEMDRLLVDSLLLSGFLYRNETVPAKDALGRPSCICTDMRLFMLRDAPESKGTGC